MAYIPRTQIPLSFCKAFDTFSRSITPEDARSFSSTELKDVWATARIIEHQLEVRRSLRGMRRIEPFLKGLEQYAKVIEVLCQGTPYLSWIWAPVKLLLQIAQGDIYALEKLIEAYCLIGEAMPRFDRLSTAFKDDPEFQHVMGLFYKDILEFHRRAYKFFRRAAWKRFFESLWKTFDLQFQAVLESLRKHRDLIDQEANALDIAESKAWRTSQLQDHRQWQLTRAEEVERAERDRLALHVREAVSWLGTTDAQEESFTKLLRLSGGTNCKWIFNHPIMDLWLLQGRDHPIIWLNGKPGAGKSTICSNIIESIQENRERTRPNVIYYFSNTNQIEGTQSSHMLRAFAAQLLAASTDLAFYVVENFANQGLRPTRKHLETVCEHLISALSSTRIVVDGLDENTEEDQEDMLDSIMKLREKSNVVCKVLVSSRKVASLSKTLLDKPTICLEENATDMNTAIAGVVRERLTSLRHRFHGELIDKVERNILYKANGMFLWVRLVLTILERLHTEQDIEEAVNTLPEGLEALYKKILERIVGGGREAYQKKAIRILQWMLAARRPLKRFEIESGIVLDDKTTQINEATKIRGDVLTLCYPLLDIEDGTEGVVTFVHFTAKEYLHTFPVHQMLCFPHTHFSVALSCIVYMCSSFELIDQFLSEFDVQSKVLSGFHDLQLYAYDYWYEHLLRLPKISISQGQHSDLNRALTRLVNFHNQVWDPAGRTQQEKNTCDNLADNEPLKALDIPLASQRLVGDVLAFQQKNLKDVRNVESTKANKSKEDELTMFSKIRLRYLSVVETLLSTNKEIDTKGSSLLISFQRRHACTAFLCPYQSCPRARQGFPSPDLLQQHQESHTLYKCTNESCTLRGLTFRTQAAFTKHINKYHGIRETTRIPSSLTTTIYQHSFIRGQPSFNSQDSAIKLTSKESIPDSISAIGSFSDDQNTGQFPTKFRKEGENWFADFNPRIERTLDVDLIKTFRYMSMVFSVGFSPDNQYFATGSNDGAQVFELATGKVISSLTDKEPLQLKVESGCQSVRHVQFSPDSQVLATTHEDNIVRTWKLSTMSIQYRFSGHTIPAHSLDFAPNSHFLASCGRDKTVRLWNLTQSGEMQNVLKLNNACQSVSVSPDSQYIAVGSHEKSIGIWNTDNLKSHQPFRRLGEFKGHHHAVMSVKFIPNNTGLLSASQDDHKTIKLWNWIQQQCLRTFEGHEDCISSLDVSLNSSWFLSCSEDCSVRAWDYLTGDALFTLEPHGRYVYRVAISPTGKTFATVSGDMTARLWSISPYEPSPTESKKRDHLTPDPPIPATSEISASQTKDGLGDKTIVDLTEDGALDENKLEGNESSKVCARCRTHISSVWKRGPDGEEILCTSCRRALDAMSKQKLAPNTIATASPAVNSGKDAA